MRSLTILLLFILLVQTGSAQHARLSHWLHKKNFPEMEQALSGPGISQQEKDLYQVFLLNAYGDAENSNRLIEVVRKSGIVKKGDSIDFCLQQTMCDNYVKLYDYASAQKANETLVKKYAHFYTKKDLKDEKHSINTWKHLAAEKAQEMVKPGDTRLPLKRDMAGLWRLPVTMGDTTVDFVFDTGAGMSTITRTYAKKMGVRLIKDAFIDVKSGVTGISNKIQLGMAHTLKIGNIVANNVVFLVFPDEAFTFPEAHYAIEGILGLPLIKAFETFTIENNEIFIPEKPALFKVSHNMVLDALKPVIYMHYQGNDLPFTFDSGANTSDFSDVFYLRYKAAIDSVATKKNTTVGGAGGTITKEVLVVPSLQFKIHDQVAVFKNPEISTAQIETTGEIYYGNIGQDLINQFKKMTISFKGSYILFE